MRLQLPSGQQVQIDVIYLERSIKRGVYHDTRVIISKMELDGAKGPKLAEGVSSCSPLDQFCKKTGRKLALKHLFDTGGSSLFDKLDRQALYAKVCNLPHLTRD